MLSVIRAEEVADQSRRGRRSVATRNEDDNLPMRRWERWSNGEYDDELAVESAEKHRSCSSDKSSSRISRRRRREERESRRSRDHRRSSKALDHDNYMKEEIRERENKKESHEKDRDRRRKEDRDDEREKGKERDRERRRRGRLEELKGEGEMRERDADEGRREKERSYRDEDKEEREKHKDRVEREKENAGRQRGKHTIDDQERNREKEKQAADQEKDSANSDRDTSNLKHNNDTSKDTDNLDYSLCSNQSTKEQVDNEKDSKIQKVREERLTMKAPEGVNSHILDNGANGTSRKIEERRKINDEKEKALQLSKVYEEQDNMMDDVESEDDDDGDVVLMLEDQSLLANNCGINQDQVDDMLENVQCVGFGDNRKRSDRKLTLDKRFQGDSHTQEGTMIQFKKPKKNNLRKKEKLETNAVEAETAIFADMQPVFVDDDKIELWKSMEIARKLTLEKQSNEGKSSPQPQVIKLVAAASSSNTNDSNADIINPNSSSAGKQRKVVVFTETEEFIRGHHLLDEEEEDEKKPQTTHEDVDTVEEKEDVVVAEVEMRDEDGCGWSGWTAVASDNRKTRDVGDYSGWSIRECAIGKGLGGALKLLRDRGVIKGANNESMDKKNGGVFGGGEDGAEREIRIERRDEFGRNLTPKEAFRVFSHKFHGKGPGKMKREKRVRQYRRRVGGQF